MTLKKTIFSIACTLFVATVSGQTLAQDAANGETVFRKCQVCHATEEGVKKIGPSLFGIFERTPGTLEGFRFSPALVGYGEEGHVWDDATLDAYLLSPRTAVPGNRMGFPGLRNEQERKDLIAYLKTLK